MKNFPQRSFAPTSDTTRYTTSKPVPFLSDAVIGAWDKKAGAVFPYRRRDTSREARSVLSVVFELYERSPHVFRQIEPEVLTHDTAMRSTKSSSAHVESLFRRAVVSQRILPEAHTYTALVSVHSQRSHLKKYKTHRMWQDRSTSAIPFLG